MTRPSPDAVRRLARLAGLDLTPEELETFEADIGTMLDYVAVLEGVDVRGFEPYAGRGGRSEDGGAMREDEVADGLSQAEALSNAPEVIAGGFGVPKVVDRS